MLACLGARGQEVGNLAKWQGGNAGRISKVIIRGEDLPNPMGTGIDNTRVEGQLPHVAPVHVITKICWSPARLLSNAICVASGDQTGPVSSKPSLGVSCVTPLPSAFMT